MLKLNNSELYNLLNKKPAGQYINNGYGREYLKIIPDPKLWQYAFSLFNLKDIYPEISIGTFYGVHYLDGAHTHQHKDLTNDTSLVHVRCNTLIKKPNIGGNPIINNKEYNVLERDSWLLFASLHEHASTPIVGGTREIYSFGALVPYTSIPKEYLTAY